MSTKTRAEHRERLRKAHDGFPAVRQITEACRSCTFHQDNGYCDRTTWPIEDVEPLFVASVSGIHPDCPLKKADAVVSLSAEWKLQHPREE